MSVKVVRSTNGKEFVLGPLLKFYDLSKIIHQTSRVNTPQQDERAERKHHHILNVAMPLRF